jgi:hypothetical protein
MNFDAFTIKMRGLIPTCTEAELSGWHDFAKENVNQGQLVDFADAEASGFDKRAAVYDWLETLYAKMALIKRRYGEDAVKLICSLGAAQSCLYPYEMDKAAEYLKSGGKVEEIGAKAVEGLLDGDASPLFPKSRDLENAEPRFVVRDLPNGDLILIDRETNGMSFYDNDANGRIRNLGKPACREQGKGSIENAIRRLRGDCAVRNAKATDGFIYEYLMTPEERARCGVRPSAFGSAEAIVQTDDFKEAVGWMCEWAYDRKAGVRPEGKPDNRESALRYCAEFLSGNPSPPVPSPKERDHER